MTNVELGKLRFDRESESVVIPFQTEEPDNSGLISVPLDPQSAMCNVLKVEAREPLRTVDGIEITGAIVISPDRELLLRRIKNIELMGGLVNGLIKGTDAWPSTDDTDQQAFSAQEDITIEEI